MRKFFLFIAALCCASIFASNEPLPGKFIINANGDQVRFSDGYLAKYSDEDLYILGPQYMIAHMAATRWLYFCWGTGNNPTEKRVQVDEFVDWGVKPIGDDTEGNLWRTLSADEWQYILSGRDHAEYLCGLAKITTEYGVYQGLMLFPDNLYLEPGYDYDGDFLDLPDGIMFESYKRQGNHFTYLWCSEYTEAQWEAVEQAGAVFLPETYMFEDDTYYNYPGLNAVLCWTSTAENNGSAKCLNITVDKEINQVIIGMPKYFSLPVRLVKDVDPTEAIESPSLQGRSGEASKVIRDGVLLIERNGKTYNAQGAQVR